MCDTVVATGEATPDGLVLFGKNSDREPNEAHWLEAFPATDYALGSKVKLTYIEIAQTAHTYALLLAKPFNIWGAEMGANEHSVVIGNEAVFTRVPYEKGPGMTGMDLLRLGLERGASARESLQVMIALLEANGQGGDCGFAHPFFYHNSFLIADPQEAWVFETAGKQWAARQVKGIYTISNGITLHSEWDMASEDLVRYAVDRGWCKGRDDFDFARCYSDPLTTRFSSCRHRCQRSTELLTVDYGRLQPQHVMAALRDHGAENGNWQPDRGLTGSQVCMHAGFGPVRINQTTGSMVSQLNPERPAHFFTATAAPCTSVFKPVWLDSGIPQIGSQPQGVYNPDTLFWQHERLHRLTLQDYPRRSAAYLTARDQLEARFVSGAEGAVSLDREARLAFSQRCFDDARGSEQAWLEKVRSIPVRRRTGRLYQTAWNRFDREAQMPVE